MDGQTRQNKLRKIRWLLLAVWPVMLLLAPRSAWGLVKALRESRRVRLALGISRQCSRRLCDAIGRIHREIGRDQGGVVVRFVSKDAAINQIGSDGHASLMIYAADLVEQRVPTPELFKRLDRYAAQMSRARMAGVAHV